MRPRSGNSRLPRTRGPAIVGQHEGFVKIVTDAKSTDNLGVHIIGPNATESIAESVRGAGDGAYGGGAGEHYSRRTPIVRGDAGRLLMPVFGMAINA